MATTPPYINQSEGTEIAKSVLASAYPDIQERIDNAVVAGQSGDYLGVVNDASFNPGTPTGNVWYLATVTGVTYANFGGLTVNKFSGNKPVLFAVLSYQNGTWQKGEILGVEDSGNLRLFLQTFDGFLISIGDSQTEQVNNGDSNTYSYIEPTATSAFTGAPAYKHLKPEFRWTNIFNAADDKNLTLLNLGVGGSRISWRGGAGGMAFNEEASHFNMLGNVSPEWSGIATTMMGWNNNQREITAEADKVKFYDVFKVSTMAVIARLLIDDFAGIAFIGWDRNGNSGVNNWSTNGANGERVSQYNPQTFMPFRLNNNQNVNRYYTRLNSGNFLQFTLTGKRAVALFLETGWEGANTTGGTFDVLVNGVVYGSYTTNYVCPATNQMGLDFFPMVIWLENVPNNCTIRINQTDTGTSMVRFLAYGWVNKTGSNVNNKAILVGSTSGNNFQHSTSMIKRMSDSAKLAVDCFNGYNVLFANVATNWVPYTDQQPDDLAHITPTGSVHIASAFSNNLAKADYGVSANFIKDFNEVVNA